MSYLQAPANNSAPAESLVRAVILGAGVAFGGALLVGTIMGMTSHQWTYVSILLGSLVGVVVSRAGGEVRMAAAAAMLSVAGSVAGSFTGVTIGIVRIGHVPLSVVLSHVSPVISAMPHIIGPFGFLCWALSAAAGWATVRSRGRRHGRAGQPATDPGTMAVPVPPGAPDTGNSG